MISSSYDLQAHRQRSQWRCCLSQTALLWFEMLPDLLLSSQACCRHYLNFCWCANAGRRPLQALPGARNVLSVAARCFQTYHNHSHGTPVPVIRDPRNSEGQPESPPRVWSSPEIDTFMFTLYILSDTPGGSHWLRSIVLMGSMIGTVLDIVLRAYLVAYCQAGWECVIKCKWESAWEYPGSLGVGNEVHYAVCGMQHEV